MTQQRAALPPVDFEGVHAFIRELLGDSLHAKRVYSVAGATTGVLTAGAASVALIGKGLAASRGLQDKHAVKQVDRLIGSDTLSPTRLSAPWCRFVLGEAKEAFINLDWTDFDADGHVTIAASLQQGRGRSHLLLWRTVEKKKLAGKKWSYVEQLLTDLRRVVPRDTRVFVVADREFGVQSFYTFLSSLDFGYILRFKSSVHVTSFEGETRAAVDWLGKVGRARSLRAAHVTTDQTLIGRVVIVRDRGMKEPWCLACSDPDMPTETIKRRYGKRFEIEETFRDAKDPRFGLGLNWARVSTPARRDALIFLVALAHGLLMLLGEAGEACGLDRMLKVNTAKTRTLSLFNQGMRWFELVPNMPEPRLALLMEAFYERIRSTPAYSQLWMLEK